MRKHLTRILLSLAATAWAAQAQTCPPIDFFTAPVIAPADGQLIAVVRQADASFTEVGGAPSPPYQPSLSIPNIQNTVAGCLSSEKHTGSTPFSAYLKAGAGAQRVAVADFDGDGALDVAVLRYASPFTVDVYLGTPEYGAKTGSPQTYSLPSDNQVVAAADVNGDGKPDLIVLTDGSGHSGNIVFSTGGILVLLNNGSGGFGKPVFYPAGAPDSYEMAMADMNGDGKLDAVVSNAPTSIGGGSLSVLLGNGDGSFRAPVSTTASSGPGSVAIGDFNGDGKPDAAACYEGAAWIFPGNGAGSLGTPSGFSSGGDCSFVATADFNGDGKADLAFANFNAQTVSVELGKGNGTFQAPSIYPVAYSPQELSITDFNNDGIPDILVGEGNANVISEAVNSGVTTVLLGNGDGTFQGASSYSLPSGNYSSFLVAADFNGDGKTDTVVNDRSSGALYLFNGTGTGAFEAPVKLPTVSTSGGTQTALAGDFNGDGKPDLVVAVQGSVDALLNTGGGNFQSPLSTPTGSTSNATTISMAAADFNGDGKTDLAVSGGSGVVLLNGSGGGSFTVAQTYSAGSSPAGVAAADLNGDGKPDLVVADQGLQGDPDTHGSVYVFLNNGAGGFPASTQYAAGSFPGVVAAGDVNGDGKPDLIVSTGDENFNYQLAVFLNTGNGSFAKAVLLPTDFGPASIAIRDFNGDGKADLVVAHCCGYTDVTALVGNGDGTFQPEVHFNGGASPNALAVADLNGDGKPDLLVGSGAGGYNAPASFTPLLNVSPSSAAAVNSASFAKNQPIAAQSIASIFGSHLATGIVQPSSVSTSVGGTTVTISDSQSGIYSAPLFYASPGQVNFYIPDGVATGTATVTVRAGDGAVSSTAVQIAKVAPGVYTADGTLAVGSTLRVSAQGQQTSANIVQYNSGSKKFVPIPINLGSSTDKTYLTLYGTGIRNAGLSNVSAQIGGKTVAPTYAGAQGQFSGEDQINFLIPYSLKGAGDVSVTITAAGIAANTVHVTIE